jgi:hypothetical protein
MRLWASPGFQHPAFGRRPERNIGRRGWDAAPNGWSVAVGIFAIAIVALLASQDLPASLKPYLDANTAAIAAIDPCVNKNITELYRSPEAASDIAAAVIAMCDEEFAAATASDRTFITAGMMYANKPVNRYTVDEPVERIRAEREQFYRGEIISVVIRRRQRDAKK